MIRREKWQNWEILILYFIFYENKPTDSERNRFKAVSFNS
jgi:hypothetical protein